MLVALNIILSIIGTILFTDGQTRQEKIGTFIISCFITPFLGIPFFKMIR